MDQSLGLQIQNFIEPKEFVFPWDEGPNECSINFIKEDKIKTPETLDIYNASSNRIHVKIANLGCWK